jgi:hypothetical protein
VRKAEPSAPATDWGFVGDKIGRRLAIIIHAIVGCFIAPLYLNTSDLTWITIGLAL